MAQIFQRGTDNIDIKYTSFDSVAISGPDTSNQESTVQAATYTLTLSGTDRCHYRF